MSNTSTEAHIMLQGCPLNIFPCVMKVMKSETAVSHWHNFFQVWYIKNGAFECTVNGETRLCEEGAAILVPMFASHEMKSAKDGSEAVVISFAEELFRKYSVSFFYNEASVFVSCRRVRIFSRLEEEKADSFLKLAEKLGGDLSHAKTRSIVNISHTVIALLAMLDSFPRSEKFVPIHPRAAIISRLIRYIEKNISKKITIQNACDFSDMSRATFVREFKKLTDMTFARFIVGVRLRQACFKMHESGKKLMTIAIETGFYDESHFTHSFSANMGINPEDYRVGSVHPYDDVGFNK